MKKSSKRLLFIIVALIVTVAVGTTSTYAWFTMNDTVTIESIRLQVKVAEGLEIAGGKPDKDGKILGNWGSTLTNYELLYGNGYISTAPDATDEQKQVAIDTFLASIKLTDLSPWVMPGADDQLFKLVPSNVVPTALNPLAPTAAEVAAAWAGYENLSNVAWAAKETKDYLVFDISLRAQKLVTGSNYEDLNEEGLSVYLKPALTSATKNSTVTQDFTVLNPFNTAINLLDHNGINQSVALLGEIEADGSNAARIAFNPYELKFADVTGDREYDQLKISNTNWNVAASTEYNIYDFNADRGYLENAPGLNLAELYFFAVTSNYRTYSSLRTALLNNTTRAGLYAELESGYGVTYANSLLTEAGLMNDYTSGAGTKPLVTLYPTEELTASTNSAVYLEGSMRVYIWLEGKDGDCFNSIMDQIFDVIVALSL